MAFNISDTLDKVSSFLFRLVNRELLTFLMFFFVAGIFWMLTTLNENYEQELLVPVAYKDLPANVVLTSGDTDTIRVAVRDKGTSMITYLYDKERQPIAIDFRRYSRSDGTGVVPVADLMPLIARSLPASASITSLNPEQLTFFYNHGEKKQVPVEYRGRVEPADIYFISSVDYSPDSVTILASSEKLATINKVYTEEINHDGIRDSFSTVCRVRRMEGVKILPEVVKVTFRTDVLTEATISDVQVVGINVPKGKVLRTFPAKVKVSLVTGMKNIQGVKPDQFLVVADYNELSEADGGRCPLHLRAMPDGLHRATLVNSTADYLIEDHSGR